MSVLENHITEKIWEVTPKEGQLPITFFNNPYISISGTKSAIENYPGAVVKEKQICIFDCPRCAQEKVIATIRELRKWWIDEPVEHDSIYEIQKLQAIRTLDTLLFRLTKEEEK